MMAHLTFRLGRHLQGAFWLVACAVWMGLSQGAASYGQLPFPDLKRISPAGAQRGQTVEVTVSGGDLDEITKLQFSHPGITAKPVMGQKRPYQSQARPEPGKFQVIVADDVPVGIHEVRAFGHFGLSNPRAFQVGQRSELSEKEPNNSLSEAMDVSLSRTINGTIEGQNYDCFRFQAQSGQRVIIDCWAQRIDSALDGVLEVYDSNGRLIARSNEYARHDPLVDVQIPQTGTYTVRLYDLTYQGGSDYLYRLTIHTDPHLDFVFPPAAAAGQQAQLTLYGRNLPGGKPADGLSIAGRPLEKLEVQIPVPADSMEAGPQGDTLLGPESFSWEGFEYRLATDGKVSNAVGIGLSEQPVVPEAGDNNNPERAQVVPVPCEVAGQFYPRNDFDWYEFQAKKDQQWVIEVISHRFGCPADPLLVVQQITQAGDGSDQVRELKDEDDTPAAAVRRSFDLSTDDPQWLLKVPADGRYRVLVRDLGSGFQADPRNVYRLIIRPKSPDFRLVAVPLHPQDNNNNSLPTFTPVLRRGGTTYLDILATRQDGMSGPIEIQVEGLPSGVTAAPTFLGGNDTRTQLVLVATESAPEWSGPLRMYGVAEIDGREVRRPIRTGMLVVPGVQNKSLPVSRMTRALWLSVIGTEVAPFFVQMDSMKVAETARAGKLEIPVTVTRRGDFQADVSMKVVGAPKEFQAKDLKISGKETSGKLQLNLRNNAPLGKYTIYLQSTGKVKYARRPEAAKQSAQEKEAAQEYAKKTAEQEKQAKSAKATADKALAESNKAVQEAERQLKQAQQKAKQKKEDADSASQLTEAQQKVEEAKKNQAEAQEAAQAAATALTEASQENKQAQDWKREAEQKASDLAKTSKPKDVNVIVASTPVTIDVAAAPVKLTVPQLSGTLKQGGQVEIPLKLERLYGFDQEVSFELRTSGVSGLKVDRPKIAQDKTEAKLKLEADKNATPGQHTATLRATLKFNGQTLTVEQELTFSIEKVEEKNAS